MPEACPAQPKGVSVAKNRHESKRAGIRPAHVRPSQTPALNSCHPEGRFRLRSKAEDNRRIYVFRTEVLLRLHHDESVKTLYTGVTGRDQSQDEAEIRVE